MFEMELCSRKQDIQRMLICKEMMTWYSVQDKYSVWYEVVIEVKSKESRQREMIRL